MYTKKRYNRKYTRKYAKPVKSVKKSIVSLNKKVRSITRMQETKSFIFKKSASYFSPNTLYSYNVIYNGATQGTGKHSFVGEKFNLRGIKLKYFIDNACSPTIGSPAPFQDTIRGWLIIFQSDKYAGSDNTLVNGDIFDTSSAGYTNLTVLPHFDSDRVKILAKRNIVIRPNFSGQLCSAYKQVYVKLNRTVHMKNWISDYELKDKNFYVGFMFDTPSNGNIAGVGRHTWDCEVFFKDT